MACSNAFADDLPSVAEVLARMRQSRSEMAYIEADYAHSLADAGDHEKPFATWRWRYASDKRESILGRYTSTFMEKQVTHYLYDGRHFLIFFPEERAGVISSPDGPKRYLSSTGRSVFNRQRAPRVLLGDWFHAESPRRLDEVLSASKTEVTVSAHKLGGLTVYRLEGLTELWGEERYLRAWIAPDRSYLPVKFEITHETTDVVSIRVEIDRFERVGTRWFPMEGKVRMWSVSMAPTSEAMRRQMAGWSDRQRRAYREKASSWRADPGPVNYGRVVVSNVKILPVVPSDAFDIELPSGSLVYLDSVGETVTVGVKDESLHKDLRAVLESDSCRGSALALAVDKAVKDGWRPARRFVAPSRTVAAGQ